MSISSGTRLGPYELGPLIGSGGMGEVYRATDTRLDRTVAIKVLPAELAADPDRRERFEREAKTISSLSHPHICTLYDVGHQDGIDYLVMEHLEGETLQDRLGRGALPLDQALRFAIEIADALDRAHRQGIVHRDLKPGNIMLGKAGAKLLDFGLAKLRGPAETVGGLSVLPTQVAHLTSEGSIVGTFQYMAPEQLEGGDADARVDIWAFGCVVYEMITGRKAFEGKSQASLSHAILGVEPRPVSDTQPVAPRSLDHVLRRCLAKAPDDRWQTVRDVHQELRWVVDQPSLEPGTTPVSVSSDPGWRRVVGAAVASLVIGAALTATLMRLRTGDPAQALVTRLQLPQSPAVPWGFPTLRHMGISADGRVVAFAGRLPDESYRRLLVRPLHAAEATTLPGTERGFDPAFSPDGIWIAYRTLNELFKVPVSGGRPISLGRLQTVFASPGLSWGENDWIYYAENIGQAGGGGLFRVHASGGEPEQLMAAEGGNVGWPQVVGDGRFVLFSFVPEGAPSWDQGRVMLLDTQTGDQRVLLEAAGASARVTTSGHLVFVQDGRVLAVPFDLGSMMVRGAPREVLGGVQYEPASGTAQWALAGNGTLVYQGGAPPGTFLTWADALGAVRAFPEEQIYYDPRLSPNGRAVAVEVLGGGDDIWVVDLSRGTRTKLSQGAGEDETPAWSPDGTWVAWSASRGDARAILQRRADGSGAEETLWSGQEHVHVSMYAPDGRSLLFEKQDVQTNTDIWLLPLDGSGTERLLVGSPFNEWNARLSPDGRWLAYSSDEAGINEVYVQPFPALDRRYQISPSGGNEAVWSRDSRQLFYRGSEAVWSVSVGPGETFAAGLPERLFEDRYGNKAPTHTGYDVGSDGRFLVMDRASLQTQVMTVVLNWFTELERLVPTD